MWAVGCDGTDGGGCASGISVGSGSGGKTGGVFGLGGREGGAREDGDGGSVTWLSGFPVGPTGRSLVVVRVLYAVANWQIGRQGGT